MLKKRKSNNRGASENQQALDKMLQEALSRPGVREMMRVYEGWREKDRGLDSYRIAIQKVPKITTTNSSRIV